MGKKEWEEVRKKANKRNVIHFKKERRSKLRLYEMR